MTFDPDVVRAYMDHVDRGFRSLNERMEPMVVQGTPAPGHGVTAQTRKAFLDLLLKWNEFFKERPFDLFVTLSGSELMRKTGVFEAQLGTFEVTFTAQTYLMPPPSSTKPSPPPYSKYPVKEPTPPKYTDPFSAMAVDIKSAAKGANKAMTTMMVVSVAVAAIYVTHEIKR